MNELYWMIAIIDRHKAGKFLEVYRSHKLEVNLIAVGNGTAVSETLDLLGLERTEKAVCFTVVTGEVWRAVRRDMQHKLDIDVPGTGIAFIVPISSIGGKRTLQFLTENQNFVLGEESTLKQCKYELLTVVANQGYSNLIMEAARGENAGGGTVIHARGTGMERAEQFMGVTLAWEKEMVLIVVKSENKNRVMRAIMDQAGQSTKAAAVVFSLPVTATAGMRLLEDEEGGEPGA